MTLQDLAAMADNDTIGDRGLIRAIVAYLQERDVPAETTRRGKAVPPDPQAA